LALKARPGDVTRRCHDSGTGDDGALFEAGRAAWPTIALDEEMFGAHLAVLGEREVDGTRRLYASDLYLACAAAHGDAPAIEAVERTCIARTGPALSRIVTRSEADDVTQVLRQRLFLGTSDGRPRLLDYAGRSELRAWVRAGAIRTAFEHLRRWKRERAHQANLELGLPCHAEDPVLDPLRRPFQAELRAAFRGALAALDPRQRTLLRQHFLEGLTTEELGSLHGVHRVTAFRWLREARAALIKRIRAALIDRLRIGRDELNSLFPLIDSRFEVTALRLLAETGSISCNDTG
jgi:RNA polymerase sigma-70 factor, ECF subfamily